MTGFAIAFSTVPRSAAAQAQVPATSRVVLPAQEGPAGPPGRDGATTDLAFPAKLALSGHRAVCVGVDGMLAYASSDRPASAETFIGITLGAAAPGASMSVRVFGSMVETSWSWSPGPVYIGLDGALTQIDPTSGYALAVGVAIAPDTLVVNPQPPFFLA